MANSQEEQKEKVDFTFHKLVLIFFGTTISQAWLQKNGLVNIRKHASAVGLIMADPTNVLQFASHKKQFLLMGRNTL